MNLPGTTWSPVTNRITFSWDREDIDEVWTIDADGTDAFRITIHQTSEYFIEPSFSPDGQWIVFQRRFSGGDDWNLFAIASDGSDLRQVTFSPSGDTDVGWSLDGAAIVYSSDYGGLAHASLFVIPANGGQLLFLAVS